MSCFQGKERETAAEVVDKEQELNEWLAITRSRDGKWWYSAFHNVTAMVGAGVLGPPYAMAELGWYVRINENCQPNIINERP